MTALAAEDALPTSDPHSKDPLLTTGNTTELKFSRQLPPDVQFRTAGYTGTPHSVANTVEHPTDADNDHHHD